MDSKMILLMFACAFFLATPPLVLRGQSSTQEIEKRKCPTVEVKGPQKSKALRNISYRAKVKDLSGPTPLVFKWSVAGGVLLSGQGSNTITVEPLALQVRATLVIENFPGLCQSNSDSVITKITNIPWMHPPPVISSITALPSVVVRRCLNGSKSDACVVTGDEVKLTADATDPAFPKLLFAWSVPVGRLKGEGKTVTWDLSGVASGTYTVIVEVGYFDLAATSTATVTVTNCNDCKPVPTTDAAKLSSRPSPQRVTSHARLRSTDTLH